MEVGSGSGSGEKNDKLFTSTELVYSFFWRAYTFYKKNARGSVFKSVVGSASGSVYLSVLRVP